VARAADHDVAVGRDRRQLLRRRHGIVGARDRERRHGEIDAGHVVLGERFAARRVGVDRLGAQHRVEPRDELRVGVRGEPAFEAGRSDRRHALGAHGRGPLQPLLGRAELERGRGQREPLDSPGRAPRQGHPDRAAERQAAERDAVDLEAVEQRERIPGELGDGPVAAMVEAQDPVAVAQRRRLCVPHLERRPQ
jgi:hypothetical protein